MDASPFCPTCKKLRCACEPAGPTVGELLAAAPRLKVTITRGEGPPSPPPNPYRKPCGFPVLDVYRVLELFEVTDPCLQHAVKKILFAGKRRGGKPAAQDVREAIESLQRWQEMRAEEAARDKGGA